MNGAAQKNRVSIIFRALDEAKWFDQALTAVKCQEVADLDVEYILVDSGSTDGTIDIANRHGCRVVHIKKSEFTFGRSLNLGCAAASGDFLIFVSAHCIPTHDKWLANILEPIRNNVADYSYGRQVGGAITRYSEHMVFAHYFPDFDKIPQAELFVNNANAAIRSDIWEKYRFDETITGLEDMVLGKALMADGGKLAYVADAPVTHIHEESLAQTRRRYYREALTLRGIFPEVQFHFGDFLRCFAAGVFHDFSEALTSRKFISEAFGVIGFRFMQYWGTYRGHNEHRNLSRAQKESYYYPRSQRQRSNNDTHQTTNFRRETANSNQ